jgi:hypothetical protein
MTDRMIEIAYEAEYCTKTERPGLRGTFKGSEIRLDYPYRNETGWHRHSDRVRGAETGRLDDVAEGIVMVLGARPEEFKVSWCQTGHHKCDCGRSHFVQSRLWSIPATPKRLEAARAFVGDSKAQEDGWKTKRETIEKFWADVDKSRLYYERMEAEEKASAAPVPQGA